MILYTGTSEQFILDNTQNYIAEKLKISFFKKLRYMPSDNEVMSWQNSLKELANIFQEADLKDNGVLLEYQLPLTSKRLDCMVTGENKQGKEEAIIIELKQWEKCQKSDGANEVLTWVGGSKKDVLHPSVQVGQYMQYLQDTHTAFYKDNSYINLNACSFLHNYRFHQDDAILDNKFKVVNVKYPLFGKDNVIELKDYLKAKVGNGNGLKILKKIESGDYRLSKKLMDHVSNVIKGKPEYILLDEQKIVYDKVFSSVKSTLIEDNKKVIIIKGGPGTGKSVIAINLMSDLLSKGFNSHYVTGSRAFTETLRTIIGSRGATQFKYFNSYVNAKENAVDVLICDEAHRIRKTSNSQFTRKENRSNIAQIDELLRVGRVCVFFIDDRQLVRPNEIGSVDYIKKHAKDKGFEIWETELMAQFRCSGSDGFVNWIDNTLAIKPTANILWNKNEDNFEFKIFKSPIELENAIKEKVEEGSTARMTAGFCWKWSLEPKKDGSLEGDIIIDDYIRPWNARPDARGLNKNISRASVWAYDPRGVNQVGCIYTAQGFEFDYVGVIFGKDLIYDLDEQIWKGNPNESYDTVVKKSKEKFLELVKNTYRVLLSRGMKGCYVYFEDKDTERFFRSRME